MLPHLKSDHSSKKGGLERKASASFLNTASLATIKKEEKAEKAVFSLKDMKASEENAN